MEKIKACRGDLAIHAYHPKSTSKNDNVTLIDRAENGTHYVCGHTVEGSVDLAAIVPDTFYVFQVGTHSFAIQKSFMEYVYWIEIRDDSGYYVKQCVKLYSRLQSVEFTVCLAKEEVTQFSLDFWKASGISPLVAGIMPSQLAFVRYNRISGHFTALVRHAYHDRLFVVHDQLTEQVVYQHLSKLHSTELDLRFTMVVDEETDTIMYLQPQLLCQCEWEVEQKGDIFLLNLTKCYDTISISSLRSLICLFFQSVKAGDLEQLQQFLTPKFS